MIAWVICGVLFLLLGLAVLAYFGQRVVYNQKMLDLLSEAEKLNQRWKLAADAIVLQAVRDAVFEERDWSDEDEEQYQKSLEVLEASGFPMETIGLSKTERPKKSKACPESYH